MSIHVQNPLGHSVIRVCGCVYTPTYFPYDGSFLGNIWTTATNNEPPKDDMIPRILEQTLWFAGDYDSDYSLGTSYHDFVDSDDYKIQGFKPVNSRYREFGDSDRYSSLLSGILAVASGSSHDELRDKRFMRDSNVRHANVDGSVVFKGDSVPYKDLYSFPFLQYGWLWPGLSISILGPAGNGVLPNTIHVDSWPLGAYSTTLKSEVPQWHFKGSTEELIDFMPTDFSWAGHDDGSNWSIIERSFHITDRWSRKGSIGISYQYAYDFVTPTGDFHGLWEVSWSLTVKRGNVGDGVKPAIPNSDYNLKGGLVHELAYSYRFLGGSKVNHDTGVTTLLAAQGSPTLTSYSQGVGAWSNCSSWTRPSVPEFSLDVGYKLQVLTDFMSHEMQQLRPSAFYSTAAAVEDEVRLLKTNFIETLADLPDVLSEIPEIGLFFKALTEFRSQPVKGALDFASFVTSTFLKANFAWRPDAGTLTELNANQDVILSAFDRLNDPDTRIVRGEFQFDLPTHSYFGARHLTTRSVLEFSFLRTELANKVLGLDSLGLLPLPSRVWEALPSSFIADWFVHMNRRLRDVETEAEFSLLKLHWVEHTFTVRSSYPGLGEISSIDQESSDVDLVWFQRDLSALWPTLTDSRYDFRSRGAYSNVGILASLIFQKSGLSKS